jgi:UDP-N-acetyl-D-glucosamine dehydrogenase
VEFAKAGFPVVGIDVDSHKVKTLAGGRSYIQDVSHQDIAEAVSSNRFTATTDFRS